MKNWKHLKIYKHENQQIFIEFQILLNIIDNLLSTSCVQHSDYSAALGPNAPDSTFRHSF